MFKDIKKLLFAHHLLLFLNSTFSDLSTAESSIYSEILVDLEKAKEIFTNTIGQAENPEWFTQRKNRITASKVQKIVRARSAATRFKYLRESSVDVPSLRYGRLAEKRARECFEKVTKKSVVECGLVVKTSQPWCAASPDGIVLEKDGSVALLEIKCPFKDRNSKISVNYVCNGKLLKTHPYFCQVQFQMYVCNIEKCYFFIYSDKDHLQLTLHYDKEYL